MSARPRPHPYSCSMTTPADATHWLDRAACKEAPDSDFYPTGRDPGWPDRARQTIATYCLACPVRADCLDDADRTEDVPGDTHGVRGGLTAEERIRRRINARRRAQKKGGARPAATISSGGADTGGAEPFANVGYRSAFARIVTNQAPPGGSELYSREIDTPSPTLTTSVRLWTFVNGTQANAARRASDWAHERPATTDVASYRPDIIAGPGYRTSTSRQDAPDSVRVTVEQAATLQGFPLGYPWRGSKTSQYRQVGNAIPPALAAHTLAALGVGDPTRLETAA